ncbi:restriction endonuclease subunit S [Exiguobacterium profundum]
MIYKDSSISWIGQIPIHWNTLSVSKAYQVTLGKMLQPNSNNENDVKTPYLKAMNVQDGYISLEKIDEMYCSANELKMLNLEVSDLVVCEGGEVARSAVVKEKLEGFIFQNSVHRVKSSEKGNTRFLHYLLIVLRASGFINILVNKATIAHFTKDKFNSLKIALPPLNEQIVISNYLDIKYDEVEILIKNKQKLITLLEQQRQSIITEAVTKGLNPNVKMKDSGVEWIGEIPENWDVNKIKFKFDIRKFIQPSENPTVLSLTQRGLKIKDLKDFSGQHAESYDKYQKVEFKDYVMNGMDLLTGYVDCSPFEGVTSPDYRVFRIKDNTECHDYYLRYFQMCYFTKIFYGHGQGVSNFGRWRLQTDVFKEFPIPVPPKNEQFEISKYLKTKESEIDKALELIKLNIEKLKEYRQSLIYEAVTGKIDVREMEID